MINLKKRESRRQQKLEAAVLRRVKERKDSMQRGTRAAARMSREFYDHKIEVTTEGAYQYRAGQRYKIQSEEELNRILRGPKARA